MLQGFIREVQSGKKALLLSGDYVIMSKNIYDECNSLRANLDKAEKVIEEAREHWDKGTWGDECPYMNCTTCKALADYDSFLSTLPKEKGNGE